MSYIVDVILNSPLLLAAITISGIVGLSAITLLIISLFKAKPHSHTTKSETQLYRRPRFCQFCGSAKLTWDLFCLRCFRYLTLEPVTVMEAQPQ